MKWFRLPNWDWWSNQEYLRDFHCCFRDIGNTEGQKQLFLQNVLLLLLLLLLLPLLLLPLLLTPLILLLLVIIITTISPPLLLPLLLLLVVVVLLLPLLLLLLFLRQFCWRLIGKWQPMPNSFNWSLTVEKVYKTEFQAMLFIFQDCKTLPDNVSRCAQVELTGWPVLMFITNF